jgi:hypothetical protein
MMFRIAVRMVTKIWYNLNTRINVVFIIGGGRERDVIAFIWRSFQAKSNNLVGAVQSLKYP